MDMKPATPTDVSRDQTYGAAIVNTSSSPTAVVITQPVPVTTEANLVLNPDLFKRKPITIKCPYCNNTVNTKVKEIYSCKACCLCCITGVCFYICVQACRDKDICCFDAEHTCPTCGKRLGNYKAC